MREQIWRNSIPKECPRADDIKFRKLASDSKGMTIQNIKNIIYRAAAKAALRTKETRQLTMADLREALKVEQEKHKPSWQHGMTYM